MKSKREPKRRQPRKPKPKRDPNARRPGETDDEFAQRIAAIAMTEWEDLT